MKRAFLALAMLSLVWLSGCGGGSPYDNGKAYAKSVISSLESGNPSAVQKAAADAQAKTKGLAPADAAKFLEGYNEVAMPYIQSKLGK